MEVKNINVLGSESSRKRNLASLVSTSPSYRSLKFWRREHDKATGRRERGEVEADVRDHRQANTTWPKAPPFSVGHPPMPAWLSSSTVQKPWQKNTCHPTRVTCTYPFPILDPRSSILSRRCFLLRLSSDSENRAIGINSHRGHLEVRASSVSCSFTIFPPIVGLVRIV